MGAIAALETLYAAAVAAVDSGDYATAIAKAQAVRIRLATLPASARQGTSISWLNASAIDAFIAECRRAQAQAAHATAGPFQTTKIEYTRPTD